MATEAQYTNYNDQCFDWRKYPFILGREKRLLTKGYPVMGWIMIGIDNTFGT